MSTARLRRGPELILEWAREGRRAEPIVRVELERAEVRLPASGMLIDTGADVSVLPFSWAPLLGLEPKRLRRSSMGGIGGGVTAWVSVGAGIVANLGIHRIDLPRVDFIAGAPAILGRDALFGSLELRMNSLEIGLRAAVPV